uniref:Cadherin domain-containing protein n=2 Tax=Caenorhabditis tropicalis TaxID=1561998 RepID=A0A1I7U4F7_9PELO
MNFQMSSSNTSLIEDIEGLSNTTVILTSGDEVILVTDSPFPSPADPFEGYVNGSDVAVITVDNNNGTASVTLFEYINLNPWLTYGLCGLAAVIVIAAIIALLVWLKNHKTRVINETSDPVLTSNYPDSSSLFSCCGCCKGKPKVSMDQRQNSSSNLEFYGRPALPQSAYQQERPQSRDSYVVDPNNLAIYIDEIEDIPNREVPREQRRELPKYRYQQYQAHD